MRLRKRVWLPVLAAVTVVGLGRLWLYAFERALVGPPHTFVLAEQPAFLTEELALAKAREALAREVSDAEAWAPVPDDRTAAPDGRRDEYLSRNGTNPNQGSFVFRGPGKRSRGMSVELVGDRVVCQSAHLK